jgi:hypothetical protein
LRAATASRVPTRARLGGRVHTRPARPPRSGLERKHPRGRREFPGRPRPLGALHWLARSLPHALLIGPQLSSCDGACFAAVVSAEYPDAPRILEHGGRALALGSLTDKHHLLRAPWWEADLERVHPAGDAGARPRRVAAADPRDDPLT